MTKERCVVVRNKNRITDFENMPVGWKMLFSTLWLIILAIFWLAAVLVGIAGAQMLFTSIDKTVIVVLVPAVFGVFTFLFTKENDRKMYILKDARDKKIEEYTKYIDFLKKTVNRNNSDFVDIKEYNSFLILISTNETIRKINDLNIALGLRDKEKILTSVENIIISIRTELGHEKIKKGIIKKIMF